MAQACPVPQSDFASVVCGSDAAIADWADMQSAYDRAAQEMPDAAGRLALQGSQQVWVEAMAAWDHTAVRQAFADSAHAQDFDRAETMILSHAQNEIRARTEFLQQVAPRLVEMRAFRGRFSGGKFGVDTVDCFYVSEDYSASTYYFCSGVMRVQQDDRLCSVDLQWATGMTYMLAQVGVIQPDGQVKTRAECNLDDPQMCGPDRPWLTDPAQLGQMPLPGTGQAAVDPVSGGNLDLWQALDDDWTRASLSQCLTGA